MQSVDPASRTLLLRGGGDAKPILVVWNKGTEFQADGVPTTAAAMKPGTAVRARYREALFVRNELKWIAWSTKAAKP